MQHDRPNPLPLFPQNRHLQLFVCFLFGGLAAILAAVVTVPAIQAGMRGQPLPADWTWWSIILMDGSLVAAVGFLCVVTRNHLRTTFTDDTISQPRWPFAPEVILRWAEVHTIDDTFLNHVKLVTPHTHITLNLTQYQDMTAVRSFIEQHVPASAVPTDTLRMHRAYHATLREARWRFWGFLMLSLLGFGLALWMRFAGGLYLSASCLLTSSLDGYRWLRLTRKRKYLPRLPHQDEAHGET